MNIDETNIMIFRKGEIYVKMKDLHMQVKKSK